MHCIPHPRMHGLNGYLEVIKAVRWGLEQLGHQVSYAVNQADPAAANILFGAQVVPVDYLKQLPKSTIVYNFEQLRGLDAAQIREEMHYCARNFMIWEYSEFQFDAWKGLGAERVRVVPVAYAPVLSSIGKAPRQDIDVLFYGISGQRRLEAFHRISETGLCAVFVSGLYGEARDDLISRAKVVLNVNVYQSSQIFEIVRVSYLLANRKAVVAALDRGTAIEPDLLSCLKFSDMDSLALDCERLVESGEERARLENAGFAVIARRDIRVILKNALA